MSMSVCLDVCVPVYFCVSVYAYVTCLSLYMPKQKFIQDPYSATIGGFSRVTHFLRDTLLAPDLYPHPDDAGAFIAEAGESSVSGLDLKPLADSDFEIVTTATHNVLVRYFYIIRIHL